MSTEKMTDQTPEKDEVEIVEGFETLFDGEELSEDFKAKAKVVFEAALSEAKKEIQADYDKKLEEATDEAAERLAEQTQEYLDVITESWMEDNKVEIESNHKVEIAEALIETLSEALVTHDILIDEEKATVLTTVSEQLEKAEGDLDKAINENIALKRQIENGNREKIVTELSTGLSESQADKFKSLVEDLKFEDTDDFQAKAGIIKEKFFKKETVITEGVDTIDPVKTDDVDETISEEMADYVSALSRIANR